MRKRGEKMKKRKTFALSEQDDVILKNEYYTQVRVGEQLSKLFEESFKNDKIEIEYKIPRNVSTIQKNILLEERILNCYQNKIIDKYNPKNKYMLNYLLSQVLSSLAHQLVESLEK